MAGAFVGADLVLDPQGNPAPNVPFTFWTDRSGGTQITGITQPDGVTPLPMVTTASGQRPDLRFPDDGTMWAYQDTGATYRQIVYSDGLATLLTLLPQIQALIAGGGGTGGGGIPAGATLDQIKDSLTRLAMTPNERLAIAALPSSYLQLGTTATTAMPGNTTFSAAAIGAVANLGGFPGIMGRTATQGVPSAAELAALPNGSYIAVDVN